MKLKRQSVNDRKPKHWPKKNVSKLRKPNDSKERQKIRQRKKERKLKRPSDCSKLPRRKPKDWRPRRLKRNFASLKRTLVESVKKLKPLNVLAEKPKRKPKKRGSKPKKPNDSRWKLRKRLSGRDLKPKRPNAPD